MFLTVNGQQSECPDSISVREFLHRLGLEGQFVAVERNGKIVSHRHFDETTLDDGDVLELVTLVGGG